MVAARLSIRWKFLLSSFAVLLFSVLLITLSISAAYKRDMAVELDRFRSKELNDVKLILKDYADIAYTLLDASYGIWARPAGFRPKAIRQDSGRQWPRPFP